MDIKNTKIWLGEDTALSEAVQNKLFELGFTWNGGSRRIDTGSNRSSLIIYDTSFTFQEHKTKFREKDHKEIYPSDLGLEPTIYEKLQKLKYKVGDKFKEGEIVGLSPEGSLYYYVKKETGSDPATMHSVYNQWGEIFKPEDFYKTSCRWMTGRELTPIDKLEPVAKPKKQMRFKTKAEFEEEYGSPPNWNSKMNYLFGLPWDKGEGHYDLHPDKCPHGNYKWTVNAVHLTDKPLPVEEPPLPATVQPVTTPTTKKPDFNLQDYVKHSTNHNEGYIVGFGGTSSVEHSALVYNPNNSWHDGKDFLVIDKDGKEITIPEEYKGHLTWWNFDYLTVVDKPEDNSWWTRLIGKSIKIIGSIGGHTKAGNTYKVTSASKYKFMADGLGFPHSIYEDKFIIVSTPTTENPIASLFDFSNLKMYDVIESPNGKTYSFIYASKTSFSYPVYYFEVLKNHDAKEGLPFSDQPNIPKDYIPQGKGRYYTGNAILLDGKPRLKESAQVIPEPGLTGLQGEPGPSGEEYIPVSWEENNWRRFSKGNKVIYPNGLICEVRQDKHSNPWLHIINRSDFPKVSIDEVNNEGLNVTLHDNIRLIFKDLKKLPTETCIYASDITTCTISAEEIQTGLIQRRDQEAFVAYPSLSYYECKSESTTKPDLEIGRSNITIIEPYKVPDLI